MPATRTLFSVAQDVDGAITVDWHHDLYSLPSENLETTDRVIGLAKEILDANREAMCPHSRLNFGSGDYYVMCADCHAIWMRKGDRPEYGTDSWGDLIGADPSKCQPGFVMLTSRVPEKE